VFSYYIDGGGEHTHLPHLLPRGILAAWWTDATPQKAGPRLRLRRPHLNQWPGERGWRHAFSKVPSIVALFSLFTRALTCQNFSRMCSLSVECVLFVSVPGRWHVRSSGIALLPDFSVDLIFQRSLDGADGGKGERGGEAHILKSTLHSGFIQSLY